MIKTKNKQKTPHRDGKNMDGPTGSFLHQGTHRAGPDPCKSAGSASAKAGVGRMAAFEGCGAAVPLGIQGDLAWSTTRSRPSASVPSLACQGGSGQGG